MAPKSVDDQYKLCRDKMLNNVTPKGGLLELERSEDSDFNQEWIEAGSCHKPVPGGIPEHAVAINVYTGGRIYRQFNTAVRTQGERRESYLKQFHYKALHFLLTDALQLLKAQDPGLCYQVYRGVNITFEAEENSQVRFGQFTSSSMNREVAEELFGNATVFNITTCLGVKIQNYSCIPEEEEVLIPPSETFTVHSVRETLKGRVIMLSHCGTFSQHECSFFSR
ncbi:NAR1 ribosyltransferase, partial [Amia calva]|nr:NAR1 ribosyltransferase [Amia calva]